MPDLLIELFSEEIPARMQSRAAADLQRLVTDGLVEAGLTYAHAVSFSTPRRLTLALEGLLAESPAVREERKGPRVDAPEKAVEGFLRSTGLTKDQLEARDDKKGQVWFAVIERPGRPAADIIAEVIERTVRNFPWPKSMRWGAGSLRWVRPLHSILCILTDEAGAQIVPVDIDGIQSSDTTQGHRFMGAGRFAVTSFDDYETRLKSANVVLRAEERAEHIWNDATNAAFALGLEVVEDKGLLAEVAGLVEWPVVLMGDIGAHFLDLPPEVLQTSMREHQKFFSVRNPKTGRIEKFITVANIETADHGAKILAGNQKVLSARLADAKFFWENDLRIATQDKMQPWLDKLENVTFHAKLGSVAEQITRIAALAREIAPMVGADPDMAEQAARLAKADLASEMVYEFPELQGVMGKYYAEAAGFDPAIAAAAEEHYAPLGPSDDVSAAPVSVAVALAEKIDKLTGFWAIDEKPTGSKDPYALRRAALGVIRLVLQDKRSLQLFGVLKDQFVALLLNLLKNNLAGHLNSDSGEVRLYWGRHLEFNDDVIDLTDDAAMKLVTQGKIVCDYEFSERTRFFPLPKDSTTELLSFIHDRLKVHLRDEGIRHDVIDASLAMPGNDDLTLLVKRAKALAETLKTEDGANLLQGFKRANNILTQAEEKDGVEYSYGPDAKLAEEPKEKALFEALDLAEAKISPAMDVEDFQTAMSEMAALRAPINAFFDAVQINADNQIIRRNRLNLLHRIREICLSVADLTKLEG